MPFRQRPIRDWGQNNGLPKGWYLTTSPVITANWEADSDNRWTLPIGGGIGRVFKIGKQPINAQVTYYYKIARSSRVVTRNCAPSGHSFFQHINQRAAYDGNARDIPVSAGAGCRLLAQSRHAQCADEYPLLGAKRTWPVRALMSANDPKRTRLSPERRVRSTILTRYQLALLDASKAGGVP